MVGLDGGKLQQFAESLQLGANCAAKSRGRLRRSPTERALRSANSGAAHLKHPAACEAAWRRAAASIQVARQAQQNSVTERQKDIYIYIYYTYVYLKVHSTLDL